jgi:putative hemolysin
MDHIIGIVHLRDLVPVLQNGQADQKTAVNLAREVLFVPGTISVNNLLHEFRSRRTHIAIVLDEFSGTAGLVTLEDLLEEIIGEVQGPFDTTPPSIQQLPDGSALIDGMTLIEDINEHFGLKLTEPYYDTIAGYILSHLGRIPKVGDSVEDRENQILLKVETMDRLRIAQVSLSRL